MPIANSHTPTSSLSSPDVLPLDNDSGFERAINISSTRIDNTLIQVRGELLDTRQDFEQPHETIVVHNIVALITFRVSDNIITDAQFGLPRMAFEGVCEHLPVPAEELIGRDVFKGLSFKIRALYAGSRSCFHLSSLLQAMIPSFAQCRSWNHEFKNMDASLPASGVPAAMGALQQSANNSCHAWAKKDGAITQDFANNNYGPMLDRMAPRLLGRWKQDQDD